MSNAARYIVTSELKSGDEVPVEMPSIKAALKHAELSRDGKHVKRVTVEKVVRKRIATLTPTKSPAAEAPR